jgi:C4-type Zn-finger protein
LIQVSSVAGKRIYFNNNNKRGGAVSKIDGVIAEIESVLEKLSGVQTRLREIKDDAEAVEKARDNLRRPKSKKGGAH